MNSGTAHNLGVACARMAAQNAEDGALDLALAWIEYRMEVGYPQYVPDFERGVSHERRAQANAADEHHTGLPISAPLMPDVSHTVRLRK
ncbi:hypothetical protein P3W85_30670 [Cupriavidus basilensis]|uniref:Uncharacterized protein n=1 Tax=Cupriavidus basilensis TaxID=68895 RepID=A0ABT6AY51_9BURK|nr:hypothetical protein [Cupriavidus basilensis]MDF3837283.1 hypothetical protein [Cupriavidus basilensis]